MQILLGIIRDLLFFLKMYVVCMDKNRLDKAILMSTHNMLFEKNRKDEHTMLVVLAL